MFKLQNFTSTFRGPRHAVVNPASGEVLYELNLATADDVDAAVDAAGKAQVAWAALPFDQRAAVLRKAATLLIERKAEFVDWTVRESGSIPAKAEWEVSASFEQLHFSAGLIGHPHGHIAPSSMPGRTNLVKRVPIGTVGVITPWNYPLLLAMRSVAPAIALGNAVLLKPDVNTAICGGLLLADIFKEAGMPEGLFAVLPGGGDVGHQLVAHPCVNMISFTGSTATGKKIGSTCGGMLKKVALELGGNNAFVVLNDADIEAAANHGAWGSFLHQGQICMQAGRHLVHKDVAKAYADALVRHAKGLAVGNPGKEQVHLGPIINAAQLNQICRIVEASKKAGAEVLAGGESSGAYYPATVLGQVSPEMPAFTEEIFGPVAPITTFSTDEELVALVNSSDYGLAAGIHTRDIARGLRIADQLRTGMVHINDQPVNAEFNVPFGGMGKSGNGGRFGGLANIEEFTQTQWVSFTDSPIAYPF